MRRPNILAFHVLPILLAGILLYSYIIPLASAMCPLCVVGAAAGLSIARYYGVDDLVIGLWLGALAVSTALWINNVIKRRVKARVVPFQGFFVVTALIAATIVPFYFAGFFNGMSSMVDTLFGVNRALIGSIIGGFLTFAAVPVSNTIKNRRGRTFPYQTIILTLLMLALFSLLFWYITKYYSIA